MTAKVPGAGPSASPSAKSKDFSGQAYHVYRDRLWPVDS
jgi:hypothetical protein